jgi:hypothetical protein
MSQEIRFLKKIGFLNLKEIDFYQEIRFLKKIGFLNLKKSDFSTFLGVANECSC